MKKQVILEAVDFNYRIDGDLVFNLIFPETGEIRQKRRSVKWLMKRIFYHELRTWKKRWGEEIEYEENEV